MRILYHHRTMGEGAEGIHIHEMVRALRSDGHTVRVASLVGEARRGDGVPRSSSRWRRVRSLLPGASYEVAEIAYNVLGRARLHRAATEFFPDILYDRYNSYSTAAIRVARALNLPLILEVNTPVSIARTRYQFQRMHFPRLAERYERWIYHAADHIFTVSSALKAFLVDERGVTAERVTVTPNAINAHDYESIGSGAELRAELGLEGRRVVGFVGSLREWHGIDLLMESIPLVAARDRDAHFLIVGKGELEDRFRSFVRDHGLDTRVTMTGWVDHDRVPRFIEAMDVALMPDSNFWGSPMKVFEYMACGKPTIAPRLGPLEEAIEDGVSGVLFERGSAPALAAAIVGLLGDEDARRRIGAAARERVLCDFTWQRNAQSVIAVAERLLAARAAP